MKEFKKGDAVYMRHPLGGKLRGVVVGVGGTYIRVKFYDLEDVYVIKKDDERIKKEN